MADKSNTSSGGTGFAGLLAILFIGLKLTGYIDWSWWWVLSPFWIPFAIVVGALAIWMLCLAVWFLFSALGETRRKWRRRRL